jgi:hypothetical protein
LSHRLIGLAIAGPICVVGSVWLPLLAVFGAVLVPASSLAWAQLAPGRAWLVAMAAGGLGVAALAGGRLPDYLAGAVAGWIVSMMIRSGRGPGRALVAGVLPFALWALSLALAGVEPIVDEIRASLDGLLSEAVGRGDLGPEEVADFRESSERALELLSRTWVASEITWFWVALAASYGLVGRLFGWGTVPRGRGVGRIDLPDWVAWVFAGALALILLGERLPAPAGPVLGWNLLVVTGFAYFIRGFAIEVHWLEKARVRWPLRVALFLGVGVVFLPFYGIATAGLGLFDTWFDFRRLQAGPGPGGPFPDSGRESGDGS